MSWLARLFRAQSADQVLKEQLFEAERLHAEHLAAAEMHAAMAGVYRGRAMRIRGQQSQHTELRSVK